MINFSYLKILNNSKYMFKIVKIKLLTSDNNISHFGLCRIVIHFTFCVAIDESIYILQMCAPDTR